MLKRYPFELDAYEAGVIMGMLHIRTKEDERTPLPVRLLIKRLDDLAERFYEMEAGGEARP